MSSTRLLQGRACPLSAFPLGYHTTDSYVSPAVYSVTRSYHDVLVSCNNILPNFASPIQHTLSPLLLRRTLKIRVHAPQMVVDVILLFLLRSLDITLHVSLFPCRCFFLFLPLPQPIAAKPALNNSPVRPYMPVTAAQVLCILLLPARLMPNIPVLMTLCRCRDLPLFYSVCARAAWEGEGDEVQR